MLATVAEANGIARQRMREQQRLLVGIGERQFWSVLSTDVIVRVKVSQFEPTGYLTPHDFTLLAIQRRMWPVTVKDGFDPRTVHVGFAEGKVALR
jgi:hypothetical protein